jgi:hypothetical protein
VLLSGAVGEIPQVLEYLMTSIRRGAMWARFGEVDCRYTRRRRMIGMISLAIDQVMLSDAK